MAWLVTGGSGYIGSHVIRALAGEGLDPVVLDDLSSGIESFVPDGVPFVRGTILDQALVEKTIDDYGVTGVIHVAGYKYAGVSVQRPLHTYEQNVTGTAVLLAAMAAKGVDRIVFSSSAAVYGVPPTDVVTEDTPKSPESPYGESKLIGEWLLRDQGVATGLRHTSLRYFNVVGSGEPSLYDASPHNLFPLVFQALLDGRVPKIFGADYATPDGTCVRDYVHVSDLALSHAVAARKLDAGETLEPAYNLGSGDGSSVKQIMDAMAEGTGIDFEPEIATRRAGDPDRIVAEGVLAGRDLDWKMRHTLLEMVQSAWAARQAAE
ncbi:MULTISPECIES: UDP-glucose 4-epimerase GalE [unclassified Frondihabitans]|uniref:UDP-glucose 4-epimerase GalE n=1 Tax=unclassified Frondihabitans TaxID=2626248 RepID=UPI000F4D4674|nr:MULTISPECIES: UDP-glucose 4-epimerase GalE [unclassified Frondihabitans]RPE79079.1 UDP-galactose 4-epimerase [Frondihabitans sp. PhB153]RPF09359.1 UDP-galactose 4-epimerase [Frondihabitans sp. PhB161]